MGEFQKSIEDESVDRLEKEKDKAMWWRYRDKLVELGVTVGEVFHRQDNLIDFTGHYGEAIVIIKYRCGFKVSTGENLNSEDRTGYCNVFYQAVGDVDYSGLLIELDV
jgi:hypothetical protein